MDDISILRARDPDKKIVGLDVAIYEGLVVDRLNSRNLMGEKLRTRCENIGRERTNRQRILDSPFASRPCTLF